MLPPAPAKNPNRKVGLLVAAALGMLVLGGGALVVYPMLHKAVTVPPHVQQDSSPLSLRVERTPGGMLLSWNRDLPVIQTAAKVILSITDGDRHENIALDPNQVRTGSILYPPITGDVSFQIEVTGAHQSKTTSESLRVLDPRPSPLSDPSSTSTPAKPAAAAKAEAPDTTPESMSGDQTASGDDNPAPHPTIPLKPFNTESLAQRLRPAPAVDLPDAPSVARSSSATASLPAVVTAQPALPPPPAQKSNAPAEKLAVGGRSRPRRCFRESSRCTRGSRRKPERAVWCSWKPRFRSMARS